MKYLLNGQIIVYIGRTIKELDRYISTTYIGTSRTRAARKRKNANVKKNYLKIVRMVTLAPLYWQYFVYKMQQLALQSLRR